MEEKENFIKNPLDKFHPVKSCKAGILSITKLFNGASKKDYEIISTIASVILLLCAFYFFFFSAPFNFPVGSVIRIDRGLSLDEISKLLYKENVIKSPFWFKAIITVIDGQGGADAGDYFFSKKRGLINVSTRISNSEYGLIPISITIPEGATSFEISEILRKNISNFDSEKFLKIAVPLEGYLFPDTYFFLPNITPENVIETIKNNFVKKISTIYGEIEKFDKPLEDIIIMASIIEEEARNFETRKIVSGILWERIKIDMPLQVDAVFPYIIGKNTYELTLNDLSHDSPYNTYKYKGLPFGPISNPGLDSIKATISPTKTNYLYYLSDRGGNMHYAKTFSEHKINKLKYIN
ncbi:MAG: endolytic transglycosylase MltG [Candidatus Paceibacterota bacterium]